MCKMSKTTTKCSNKFENLFKNIAIGTPKIVEFVCINANAF